MTGQVAVITGIKWSHGKASRFTYMGNLSEEGYIYFNDDRFYRMNINTEPYVVELFYIDKQIWIRTNNFSEIEYGLVKASTLTNISTGGGSVAATEVAEAAVTWAIEIANNPNFGYDWDLRDGQLDAYGRGAYDCSSLVWHAFRNAGLNLGATAGNTETIVDVFPGLGFESIDVTAANHGDVSGLQRGDVLVHRIFHTEIYIGNNMNVGAHINENGDVRGGEPGDQTGQEICVAPYWVYVNADYGVYGWTHIFRYRG